MVLPVLIQNKPNSDILIWITRYFTNFNRIAWVISATIFTSFVTYLILIYTNCSDSSLKLAFHVVVLAYAMYKRNVKSSKNKSNFDLQSKHWHINCNKNNLETKCFVLWHHLFNVFSRCINNMLNACYGMFNDGAKRFLKNCGSEACYSCL